MVQICPKTMRECATTSMCSPFGGCSTDTGPKDAEIARLTAANKALTAELDALKHDITRHVQIASDEAALSDSLVASKARISAELAEARKLLTDLIPPQLDWKELAKKGNAEGIQVEHPYAVIRAARSFLASKEASHAE